jgi:hypothetical protein
MTKKTLLWFRISTRKRKTTKKPLEYSTTQNGFLVTTKLVAIHLFSSREIELHFSTFSN